MPQGPLAEWLADDFRRFIRFDARAEAPKAREAKGFAGVRLDVGEMVNVHFHAVFKNADSPSRGIASSSRAVFPDAGRYRMGCGGAKGGIPANRLGARSLSRRSCWCCRIGLRGRNRPRASIHRRPLGQRMRGGHCV